MERLLYGKGELAAMLGVSKKTIERATLRGVIPSVRLGRRRLYAINQVLEALQRLSDGGQQPPRRGRPRKPLSVDGR